MTRYTGHSMKRPPKKCSVCRKPIVPQLLQSQGRCECERCICNILEGKREPSVCEDCKSKKEDR